MFHRRQRFSDFASPREWADHMPSPRDLAGHLPSARELSPWHGSHGVLDTGWGRAGLIGAGVLAGVGLAVLLAPRLRATRRRRGSSARSEAYRGNGDAERAAA